MAKFHNAENTIVEHEGKHIPVDPGNRHYQALLDGQVLIDRYEEPPDSRTYRQRRSERYTDELTNGDEKENPMAAIGDVIDDMITAFTAEFPEYTDPSSARGKSPLGKKIAKIAKIKREIPKP